jgi:hypothetical protein
MIFGAWLFIDRQKLDAEDFYQYRKSDKEWKLRKDFDWITQKMEYLEAQYDCYYDPDKCLRVMPPEAKIRYGEYLNQREFIKMELQRLR